MLTTESVFNTQAFNFVGRSFLALKDYSQAEILYLLELAAEFKSLKKNRIAHRYCEGKNIALLFEKASTRTRCAFTIAANDLGINAEFLSKSDLQLGKKETVEDTAKVLGRMFDGIEFRGASHAAVEQLAEFSGVPVWNGLTDLWHPTQILADFLTIKEVFGQLKNLTLLYCGDGRNNMANSMLVGCAKVGINVRIASPKALFPQASVVELAREIAEKEGHGSILITDDIDEAAPGADILYTDVWVSMGEEAQFAQRIELLKAYQINEALLAKTGKSETIFLHCLPAFHDINTQYGQDIFEQYGLTEMEVTDGVFRSPHAHVFDEAENRLHTIKAVLAATLGRS